MKLEKHIIIATILVIVLLIYNTLLITGNSNFNQTYNQTLYLNQKYCQNYTYVSQDYSPESRRIAFFNDTGKVYFYNGTGMQLVDYLTCKYTGSYP